MILYEGLGQKGHMPLLLSAVWITTAALIYNPGGAWLHDKVNSRRWMFITGFVGVAITTSCLAAMIACFAGTDNRAGNAMGFFFIFLYLAFQGTFCDTTMYTYISEIFPTEIRSIGMGFSLFGQFAGTFKNHFYTRFSAIWNYTDHDCQPPLFFCRLRRLDSRQWAGSTSW